MALTDKEKALDLAIGQIEKQFGKGSIMRLGREGAVASDISVIPTGSPAIDMALGSGGVPGGRVVEFFAPEFSGKTPRTLHTRAGAKKKGGVPGFIDAEHP